MKIVDKLKTLSTAQKVGAGVGVAVLLGTGVFLGYKAFMPQESKAVATATVTLNKTKAEAKKAEAEMKKVEEEKAKAEAEVKKAEEEKRRLETELANATTEDKKAEIRKQIEEKTKVVEAKKETVKKIAVQVENKKQEVVKKTEEVKKAEVVVETKKAEEPKQATPAPSKPQEPEKPKDVITTKEVVENGRTETIAFETEVRQDANLEKGKTRVEREGQNGEKVEKITYTVTYTNGTQTSKTEKSRSWETVSQPVSKIVIEGTKSVKANKAPHPNQVAAEAAAARINEIRASKGLPLAKFRYDHSYAQKQAESGTIEHWQGLGENLGRDANRDDVQSGRNIVDGWMLDGHAMKINREGEVTYTISVYKVYHGRGLPVNWYVLY